MLASKSTCSHRSVCFVAKNIWWCCSLQLHLLQNSQSQTMPSEQKLSAGHNSCPTCWTRRGGMDVSMDSGTFMSSCGVWMSQEMLVSLWSSCSSTQTTTRFMFFCVCTTALGTNCFGQPTVCSNHWFVLINFANRQRQNPSVLSTHDNNSCLAFQQKMDHDKGRNITFQAPLWNSIIWCSCIFLQWIPWTVSFQPFSNSCFLSGKGGNQKDKISCPSIILLMHDLTNGQITLCMRGVTHSECIDEHWSTDVMSFAMQMSCQQLFAVAFSEIQCCVS